MATVIAINKSIFFMRLVFPPNLLQNCRRAKQFLIKGNQLLNFKNVYALSLKAHHSPDFKKLLLMKRRNFIAGSAIASATMGSIFTSCKADKKPLKKTAIADAAGEEFELNEITIQMLQEKFQSGVYSSEQVTNLYLERIAGIDKSGPALNAVIELNPDAIAIARSMDEERKAGKIRGLLHGVPVLIKDNIDTGDKMQTTAGSLAMLGNVATGDAFIVKKLREAGAVLLGKTNLSEWANFRSTKSCSGWSSRGGQTKNPYILDHNPCGSSSGSGVAVAANLCTVAIGTETDGSVTCPAAVNGLVGLKPTVGLLSRSGIIPISHTQDTAGPMARTVTDAAILLGALAGEDPEDGMTTGSVGKVHRDYTKFLNKNALSGKRIGVEKKPQGDNHLMHLNQEWALRQLGKMGATVVEIEYLDKINKLGDAEFEVLQYEFKDGLNKYLAQSKAPVKTLAEVILFNKQNEDKAMPYFKQETLESSEAKKGLDTTAYKEALSKNHEGTKKILDDVIKEHNLDAICGHTMGPACSIDNIYGDRWGSVFLTQPAASSGYPHITVPVGMIYDLPVGFSFFGASYSEPALLGFAYAFEQATNKRQLPGFRKSFL
jgi:amidase